MDDNILRYTLRVNRTLFQKFRYIADYEGRSANREIEQYIKQRVKAFEEKHGEIEVEEFKGGYSALFLLQSLKAHSKHRGVPLRCPTFCTRLNQNEDFSAT